jgi:hypothetical protein
MNKPLGGSEGYIQQVGRERKTMKKTVIPE